MSRATSRRAAATGSIVAPPLLPVAGWLLRDGRTGRVVAHSQGGLLCRVRLDGRAGPGETIECSGSELVLVTERPVGAEGSLPGLGPEEVTRDARGLRSTSTEVRVVLVP